MTARQLGLPAVDETLGRRVDLSAAYERLLRSCTSAVDLLGHKEVAIDLDVRGSFLSNALHDRAGEHLYAVHLAYLNINGPDDEIAEEFAAQRGRKLADVDTACEVEELALAVSEEFGGAGARFIAKWRARRNISVAVNIPKRIRK